MKPKKFILVHGAWHPRSCWHRTSVALQQMGHSAVAIQLKGLGRDSHPLKDVHLEDHVHAVRELCLTNSNGEHDLVLVGHSYGGVIISQVAELIPECLEQCVYLSGIMIQHGECVMDVVQHFEDSLIVQAMQIAEQDCAINLPEDVLIPGFFSDILNEHITAGLEKEVRELCRYIGPQPLNTFLDRVSLGVNYQSVPKVYVECTEDRAIPFSMQRWMHQRDSSDKRIMTLHTGHSPYITNLMEMLTVLVRVAKWQPSMALKL